MTDCFIKCRSGLLTRQIRFIRVCSCGARLCLRSYVPIKGLRKFFGSCGHFGSVSLIAQQPQLLPQGYFHSLSLVPRQENGAPTSPSFSSNSLSRRKLVWEPRLTLISHTFALILLKLASLPSFRFARDNKKPLQFLEEVFEFILL